MIDAQKTLCGGQVLTLANGDRILMTPQMKAMFETENLNNASPATVSRAGIIYVSDVELGWGPVVESWLGKKRESEVAALRPCFDKLVGAMLDYVRYGPRTYAMCIKIPPLHVAPYPDSAHNTSCVSSQPSVGSPCGCVPYLLTYLA